MRQKKIETINIGIEKIVPDKNQPRKLFEPTKLAVLKQSIAKYGIMNPLIVEKNGSKFLIVDGERRYRVATIIGLTEVPAIVIEAQNEVQRLVQQFHIQEQHEGWTATEKAMTLHKLCKELKVPELEAYKLLGINPRVARSYRAFGNLVEKDMFQKNDLQLDWAERLQGLKALVRRIYAEDDKVWNRTEERRLEKAIIGRIVDGTIQGKFEFTKLKDSFTKNAKSIEEFLNSKITPDALFIKTKAKGAYYLRNLVNAAGYLTTNGGKFLESGDVKVDKQGIHHLKMAKNVISKVLDKVE